MRDLLSQFVKNQAEFGFFHFALHIIHEPFGCSDIFDFAIR